MTADYQSGFSIFSQWNYSANHFKACFASPKDHSAKSLGKSIGHFALGVIDALPVIGLLSSFLEKKIVNANPKRNLRNRELTVKKELNTLSRLFQRLYFETQSGLTRKGAGQVIPELDTANNDLMLFNMLSNIETFLQDLPQDQQEKYKKELQPILNILHKAKELFLKVGLLVNTSSPAKQRALVNEIAQDIVSSLQALNPGQSMLLPGGYTNIDIFDPREGESGHILLYEVTKQLNGNFSFKVYNSGEGLSEKHNWQFGKNLTKKYSNQYIADIPPGKLDAPFFKTLASMAIKPNCDQNTFEKVYTHLETLGKLQSDDKYRYCQGDTGSCAYQCLVRWFKDQVPKEVYYRVTTHTIQHIQNKIEDTCGKPPPGKPLLSNTKATKIEHSVVRLGYTPKNKLRSLVFSVFGFFTGDRISFRVKNSALNTLMKDSTTVLEKRSKKIGLKGPV